VSSIRDFIGIHAVVTYYILTFIISWGGFLLVGGTGLISGTNWKADPRFPLAIPLLLAGPPTAGLASTALVSGRAGLRELLSRLLRWRAGARWYARALLPAMLLQAAALLGLSLRSPVFLPAIATSGEPTPLVVSGIIVGLVGGLVEELGWTGFAIPRLLRRHGLFSTGLFVGALWGLWHLPQMWWVGSTSAEGVPQALFLAQYFSLAVAALTAYRVLMVWVYDRTGSLLVAVLMHASYIASTLFILAPPTSGRPYLTYAWVWTAALWLAVAVVVVANRGLISRQPPRAGPA
jgi:membrane protease YdiL (CAAX protease family)